MARDERVCPFEGEPCREEGYLRQCYRCGVYQALTACRRQARREKLARRASVLLYAIHVRPLKGRVGVAMWYRRLLVLRPEALRRHGLPLGLRWQMFAADNGPGCLPGRPVGEIDGLLICSGERATFLRSDFYGVANESGIRLYRQLTGLDPETIFGDFGGGLPPSPCS